MSNCKSDYIKILDAWENNVSHCDIYHMLLNWINTYIENIYDHNAVKDMNLILDRIKNDDSMYDIVESFVVGKKYLSLHSIMLEME
jgi:hypothetical protein